MCSSVEVSGVRVRGRQSGATLGLRLAHRGPPWGRHEGRWSPIHGTVGGSYRWWGVLETGITKIDLSITLLPSTINMSLLRCWRPARQTIGALMKFQTPLTSLCSRNPKIKPKNVRLVAKVAPNMLRLPPTTYQRECLPPP